MATKLHIEAVKAVEAWCKKHKLELVGRPRHVHPQAYVVGHAASACLIVSGCWADSEPHLRERDKKYPLKIVNHFDESLNAGDWCITAYVSVKNCGGWPVAIPLKAAK